MNNIHFKLVCGILLILMCLTFLPLNPPEYVNKGKERLASYLTTIHFDTSCRSYIHVKQWMIKCKSINEKIFLYEVYPAEKAPYNNGREFYLIAANENAIREADEGLLHYLKIGIKNS